jgi:hypothetical protein
MASNLIDAVSGQLKPEPPERGKNPTAVALHFAHYNLVRVHKTLRMTPAMRISN